MKSRLTLIVLLCFMGFLKANVARADQPTDSLQQELWQQPDFVRAYYVVVEPGGALYSVFGHACLHMVCPAYGLDYFFSYESEDAVNKIWSFLAGNLRMGMRALAADEYLSGFAEEGRGVKEYELNLPIAVKRELWRVLDDKTAEGMELPYDFETRGCAYTCVKTLEEALGEMQIEYADWSPRFNRTRREICNDFGKYDYPWNMLFVMSLVGADDDNINSPTEKLIIPTELAEVWQLAKVNGEFLLSREAHHLLPSSRQHKAPWFTPIIGALILLALAFGAWFVENPYLDWLVLAIVTLIGAVTTYLVVFSSLPCTEWNWLIVPFNILPVIGWKWRRYWSAFYAIVIVCWVVGMLVTVHIIADKSMIVTALAFALILLNKRNTNVKFIIPCRERV